MNEANLVINNILGMSEEDIKFDHVQGESDEILQDLMMEDNNEL